MPVGDQRSRGVGKSFCIQCLIEECQMGGGIAAVDHQCIFIALDITESGAVSGSVVGQIPDIITQFLEFYMNPSCKVFFLL